MDGTDAILYQLNTRHSEATRNQYYLKPATDEKSLYFLTKKLNLIEDPENCYVADDEPSKPMPEVADHREEVQKELHQGEDEIDERRDEGIHDGDAVTQDAVEENITEDSGKENSTDETLSLANDDSFPDVYEYEPPKKSRKNNPAKEEPAKL